MTARKSVQSSTALSARPLPLARSATLAFTSIVSTAAANASPTAITAPTLKTAPSALQDTTTTSLPASPAHSSATPATQYPAPRASTATIPVESSASNVQVFCPSVNTAQLELTAALVLPAITLLAACRGVSYVVRLRLVAALADQPLTALLASPTTTLVETYARPAYLMLPYAVPPLLATAVSAEVLRCAARA